MSIYEFPFAKWLCNGAWDNRMPYSYSTDLRNMRIQNQVSTVRKGYKTVVDDIVWTTVKGIASNNSNLYVAVDSKLKSVDITNWNYTNIWNLPNNNDTNIITFGKYSIILTGGQPYVYDWTTLYPVTQSTSSVAFTGSWLNDMTVRPSATNTDWQAHTFDIEITATWTPDTFKWRMDWWAYTTGVSITGWIHILSNWMIIIFNASTWHTNWDKWTITQDSVLAHTFWTEFLNFTWVAWDTDFPNVVYQSVPVVATNQTWCYDWLWSWANQMTFKWNILWLTSTLSRMFIFTTKSIEYIEQGSYVTIWWVLNFYPKPLSEWEPLVNNRCAVAVWDKVFFLTKDKKIKTIKYIQWIDNVVVWDLSDDEKVWIPKFMNNLNDDLTWAVWFYDRNNKLVKFFVRSKNSTFNDVCIIWDLVNKTFLVDDNKFFSCLTYHNNKIYAWSCLNSVTYQDEVWQDDDWWPLSWYRYSAILSNNRQNKNKLTKRVTHTGTINSETTINQDIILDWDIIDTSSIQWVDYISWWTGASPTWWSPTWWDLVEWILVNYTKDRWPEYINNIGRYLQVKHYWSWTWQDFTLETMETDESLTAYLELTDK